MNTGKIIAIGVDICHFGMIQINSEKAGPTMISFYSIDKEMTMQDPDRQALLEKKAELEARLEKIKNDLKGGLDADFEEQAVQLENRDVLMEIARVTEEELEKLKAQLDDSK